MNNVHARTARDSIINNSGLLQIAFLRMTSDSIRILLKADEEEVKAMQQELALLREGSLCISKRGEGFRFNRYDKQSQETHSITKDSNQIYDLARRAYLENRHRLSAVLENTEGARHDLLLQKKLGKFAAAGLDLSRILFTKEQIRR